MKQPLILLWIIAAISFSCEDTTPTRYGCMDPMAINYDSLATVSSGNCLYAGCTDPAAVNYDPAAVISDNGTCIYPPMVTFWTTQTGGGLVTISLSGTGQGSAIFAGFTPPECGAAGSAYATFTLNDGFGAVTYTAWNGLYTWTGTIYPQGNGYCELIELQ